MKEILRTMANEAGAYAVGFAGEERLKGPQSMNPEYLLPGAKSIISLMIPLDKDIVKRYLAKEDHQSYWDHSETIYKKLYTIGEMMTTLLKKNGYKAFTAEPNFDYRFKDKIKYRLIPYSFRQWLVDWLSAPAGRIGRNIRKAIVAVLYKRVDDGVDWNLTPSYSNRYGAVAAGIGTFGWSGNILHPEHGALGLYLTVVTTAPFESDPMIEETLCDGCRTCVKVCQSGFIEAKHKAVVEIGGRAFTHNKKNHNLRCILVCAGFTGQSKFKDWSTWSPGKFDIPEKDDILGNFWSQFLKKNLWQENYNSKNISNVVFMDHYGPIRAPELRFPPTCGNCQLVCFPSRKERKENYEIIKNSGCNISIENSLQ